MTTFREAHSTGLSAIIRTAFVLLMTAAPSAAQVPGMVSFQGVLKDSGGNALQGSVTLDFRIYDAATGGNLVDMDGDGTVENTVGEDVKRVTTPAVTGVVSTQFGPVSPLVLNGQPRFIEVTIVSPGPTTALSRVPMTTAPAAAEQLYARGTTNVAVTTDASGNVGVGTSTPNTRLHVRSEGQVLDLEGSLSAYLGFYPRGLGAGRKGFFGFSDPTQTNMFIYNEFAGGHIVLSPQPDGRVGIGTISPTGLLTVASAGTNTEFHISNTSSGGRLWSMGSSGSAAGTGPGFFRVSDLSAGIDRMVISPTGNVGIGTTTPQASFDVTGTARMTGFQLTTGPVAGRILTSDAAGNGSWQAFPAAGGDLTGTYPSLTIANGAVTLTNVAANAVDSARIVDGSITSSDIQDGGVWNADLANDGVSSAKLASDSASLSRVTAGGMTMSGSNLGIGTASPATFLDLQSSSFQVAMRASAAPANQRVWRFANGGGSFALEAVNDALTGGQPVITCLRNGSVGIGRVPNGTWGLEVQGSAWKSDGMADWNVMCDRRIKKDIEPVDRALETVDRLKVHRFRYTDEYLAANPGIQNRSSFNVIAQEFAEVFPEYVQPSGQMLPDGSDAILNINPWPLTIYSVAAIQELHAKHNAESAAKDAQITAQQRQIDELKQRLERLEKLLAASNEKAS